MKYEIAKQLKECGFPQNPELLIAGDDDYNSQSISYRATGFHVTFDFSVIPEPDFFTTPFEKWDGKERASIYMTRDYLDSEEGKFLTVYKPTLSELIQACGKYFLDLHTLERKNDGTVIVKWGAGSFQYLGVTVFGQGDTPEEAVAKLWIALNQK